MLLNKNIILEIFDFPIDYAMLDSSGEMEIEEYFVADDGKAVNGVFEIEAFLEGYVFWEGESEYWDIRETRLAFRFEFDFIHGKATDFKIYDI